MDHVFGQEDPAPDDLTHGPGLMPVCVRQVVVRKRDAIARQPVALRAETRFSLALLKDAPHRAPQAFERRPPRTIFGGGRWMIVR